VTGLSVAGSPHQSFEFIADAALLLAVVLCVPLAILVVGVPFALIGRLVLEIIHRF
jgi:hypothetical protein